MSVVAVDTEEADIDSLYSGNLDHIPVYLDRQQGYVGTEGRNNRTRVRDPCN